MKKTLTTYLILISLSCFSQETKTLIGTWIPSGDQEIVFIELKESNEFNFVNIDSQNDIKIVKGTWSSSNNDLELKIGNNSQKMRIEKIDNGHLVLKKNNKQSLIMNRLKNSSNENTISESVFLGSVLPKAFKIYPESKKGLFKIRFKQHNKAQVYLYTAMLEVTEFEVPWKTYIHNNHLLLILSDFAIFSINSIDANNGYGSINLFSYRMSNPEFIGSELVLREEVKTFKEGFMLNLEYASPYVNKTMQYLNKLDSEYVKTMKTKGGSMEGRELTNRHFQQTDSILNDVYQKTLVRYNYIRKDTASIGVPLGEKTGYINSQKAWIKFKKIETVFLCNSYENRQGWHTGLNTSCLLDKIRLTKERIEHLLKHYDRIELN